jgi:hypothetical protein
MKWEVIVEETKGGEAVGTEEAYREDDILERKRREKNVT